MADMELDPPSGRFAPRETENYRGSGYDSDSSDSTDVNVERGERDSRAESTGTRGLGATAHGPYSDAGEHVRSSKTAVSATTRSVGDDDAESSSRSNVDRAGSYPLSDEIDESRFDYLASIIARLGDGPQRFDEDVVHGDNAAGDNVHIQERAEDAPAYDEVEARHNERTQNIAVPPNSDSGPSTGSAPHNRRSVTFGYPPRRLSSNQLSRRSTREVILPRWQPDAEVTFCPICRTQFSFFVRKHHCRRCGRVVCSSCSPHRITIPYQYIVQPPPPADTLSLSALPSARNDTSNQTGGMKVRLCNPCVPDPNPLPPQQPFEGDAGMPSLYSRRSSRPYSFGGPSVGVESLARPENRRRLMPRDPTEPDSPLRRMPISASLAANSPMLDRHRFSYTSTGSSSNPQPHYRSLLDVGTQEAPPQSSRSSQPLPPAPPHNEEDECPICHRVLFSSSEADFEERKAAHVMQCIEQQISFHGGNRPRAHTAHSTPVPPTSDSSPSSSPRPPQVLTLRDALSTITAESRTSASTTPMPAPAPASAAAPLSSSPPLPRRTGMFIYRASEKDCVDDAECTICLEEFEVGAQMARLECFCRFHRRCIMDWFVQHPGRCPVHQHDGFGF